MFSSLLRSIGVEGIEVVETSHMVIGRKTVDTVGIHVKDHVLFSLIGNDLQALDPIGPTSSTTVDSGEVMPSRFDNTPISVPLAAQELVHTSLDFAGPGFMNEGTRVPEKEDGRITKGLLGPVFGRPWYGGIRQHGAKS